MNSFCIEVEDAVLKITAGKCRRNLKQIVLESIRLFVSKEDFPIVIKGMLDDKNRIGTLIITGSTQHLEINYPILNKDGYSYRSVLFMNYVENQISQRVMISGKKFKAILYDAPSSNIKFEMEGAFKSIEAMSKKAQIEQLLVELDCFFTLPTIYDPDKIITTVCKCLKVTSQEFDSLKIPDKLEIKNGEIVEAFVLGDGFCVFFSKEDRSVKYVSKGFSVEEYPAIQKRSLSYVKYDTFDVAVLENLHKEATEQIVALLQTVAQFKNYNM